MTTIPTPVLQDTCANADCSGCSLPGWLSIFACASRPRMQSVRASVWPSWKMPLAASTSTGLFLPHAKSWRGSAFPASKPERDSGVRRLATPCHHGPTRSEIQFGYCLAKNAAAGQLKMLSPTGALAEWHPRRPRWEGDEQHVSGSNHNGRPTNRPLTAAARVPREGHRQGGIRKIGRAAGRGREEV